VYLSALYFGRLYVEAVGRAVGIKGYSGGCSFGGTLLGLANVLTEAIADVKAPLDGSNPVVSYC
jgi:hypothetical protein